MLTTVTLLAALQLFRHLCNLLQATGHHLWWWSGEVVVVTGFRAISIGIGAGLGGLRAVVTETGNHGAQILIALADLLKFLEQFNNGAGVECQCVHHLAHSLFDALGDSDLTLAGQQLYRAHLAHVHAYRVRCTASFSLS